MKPSDRLFDCVFTYSLIDWLIDSLIHLLIDCLIDPLIDWLIDYVKQSVVCIELRYFYTSYHNSDYVFIAYRFTNTYEEYEYIADALRERTRHKPTIAVICGSGLGGLADLLEDPDAIDYEDIPYFPLSTGKTCKKAFKLSNARR